MPSSWLPAAASSAGGWALQTLGILMCCLEVVVTLISVASQHLPSICVTHMPPSELCSLPPYSCRFALQSAPICSINLAHCFCVWSNFVSSLSACHRGWLFDCPLGLATAARLQIQMCGGGTAPRCEYLFSPPALCSPLAQISSQPHSPRYPGLTDAPSTPRPWWATAQGTQRAQMHPHC